jgi:hypothetical protein
VADLLAVGFTASRELDEHGRQIILDVLHGVPLASRYVTGGCIGGDSFIGRWLFWNRPDAEHVVVVPADRSRVDPWWTWVQPVTLIVMPPGTTYRDRNERLVAESTVVYGFPAYVEEDPRSRRSGTWQAARMARRAQKLSQWHCVRAPFRSWVEILPGEFGTVSAG